MKEILLSGHKIVLVDDEDYEYLNQFRWRAKKDGKTYYAYRTKRIEGKQHYIAMHREIMKTPPDLQVDHKDWNGLNNQRSNLRNCTRNDNCRWVQSRSNTGYLGVSMHTKVNKDNTIYTHYTADIKCNGTIYRLGNFNDPYKAAHAYDKAAKQLFGEFANLNFKDNEQKTHITADQH